MSYVNELIAKEEERQRANIELIASENYVSDDIRNALGSCLTNKYAEGYPGNRYYGGCQAVDEIEEYCKKASEELHADAIFDAVPKEFDRAKEKALTEETK